jgi:hypothetical protein
VFFAPQARRCRAAGAAPAIGALAATIGAALLLGACSRPAPRTFDFFLADRMVREGVIARCDAHPLESQRDIECANARRAATAEQLQEEQAKRKELERESERKLEALRRQYAARIVEREEKTAALAEAAPAAAVPPPTQPAFGAPLASPLVGAPSAPPVEAPQGAPSAPPVEIGVETPPSPPAGAPVAGASAALPLEPPVVDAEESRVEP